jgi:hypothetical protein
MVSQTDRHSYNKYSLKWVYSSKKLALQKIVVEYFSNSPLDFAPIHLKIAGLLALLRIAKISYYSISALAPFPIVQQTTCLNQKTTLNQSSQILLSL